MRERDSALRAVQNRNGAVGRYDGDDYACAAAAVGST